MKAVQTNQQEQQWSLSIVESDEEPGYNMQSRENVEDSKPAAVTALDLKLTKIQHYHYCDWRGKTVNKPVVDDSPSFVNESASKHFDKVKRMSDHQNFLHNSYLGISLKIPEHNGVNSHLYSTYN